MLHFYQTFIIIICITAAFAYVNERFIKWPAVIGIMVLSLVGSIFLLIAGKLIPQVEEYAIYTVSTINFPVLMMRGMLGLMLFAGSIQMSERQLKKERVAITVLSIVGTALSVFMVGTLVYYTLPFLGINGNYIHCLLFGAIISPTDPIAVLSILRGTNIPKSLEVKITGESLFNDGVGVVIFTSLFEIARQGFANFSISDILLLFGRQAIGGILFGMALGYAGFLLLKPLMNYQSELILTLALVMGGYALAEKMNVSGPLAMVVAGIITGNKSGSQAMGPISRDYVTKFWEVIDEVLNAVLFLLIGLEMLLIKLNLAQAFLGAACVLIVLFSRWASVSLPVLFTRRWVKYERGAIAILTWGGLRGGISIAMALSLPSGMGHDLFAPATYTVVVFSILVQGLTIKRFARKFAGAST